MFSVVEILQLFNIAFVQWVSAVTLNLQECSSIRNRTVRRACQPNPTGWDDRHLPGKVGI